MCRVVDALLQQRGVLVCAKKKSGQEAPASSASSSDEDLDMVALEVESDAVR